MERKIGEIFEYNGEWYQCVGGTFRNCSFYYDTVCKNITNIGSTNFGNCHCSLRTDHKSVIFKKLEKVGEPYDDYGTILQRFRIHTNVTNADTKGLELHIYSNNTIGIEIVQNQEDMEEKKLNLKPFDLEAARSGKPVCTRDGRKARIICFDGKGDQPIIALVEAKGNKDALIEKVERYFINGHSVFEVRETNDDLIMLPEKKEGWVNIYKDSVYDTKDEALIGRSGRGYIDTIKVSWEE